MSSPFDFVHAINQSKNSNFEEIGEEKDYVPFVVNKSLSFFHDTVHYANEMNRYSQLPKQMQFSYLLNSITKRKRSGWVKKDKATYELLLVKEYFNYSIEKAEHALSLLTKADLTIIETKLYKGGR